MPTYSSITTLAGTSRRATSSKRGGAQDGAQDGIHPRQGPVLRQAGGDGLVDLHLMLRHAGRRWRQRNPRPARRKIPQSDGRRIRRPLPRRPPPPVPSDRAPAPPPAGRRGRADLLDRSCGSPSRARHCIRATQARAASPPASPREKSARRKGFVFIVAGQDAVADAQALLDPQPHQAMGAFRRDHLEMKRAGLQHAAQPEIAVIAARTAAASAMAGGISSAPGTDKRSNMRAAFFQRRAWRRRQRVGDMLS